MSAELDYPKYGSLTPAFLIHIEVAAPTPILTNSAGSITLAKVNGGYTKTINPSFPFDTEVVDGYDRLTATSSQPSQLLNQNCTLYLKSKANGKCIVIDYTGVINPSELQGKVMSGELEFITPDQTYITNTLKFHLDDGAKEESWVHEKLTVSKGRLVRDENGVLALEYVVYVLE